MRQVRAIDAFNAARRLSEAAAETTARTREARTDAARTLEVLRRQHEALVARSHEQLRSTGELLGRRARPRAVLAHRNTWFAAKVADQLEGAGLEVVARLENGADAVGVVIAEQPDLLLVEDSLAMLPGEQVVREVRGTGTSLVIAAQVPSSDRVGVLLDAGADAVFTDRCRRARWRAGRSSGSPRCCSGGWLWGGWGSNPRPRDYERPSGRVSWC